MPWENSTEDWIHLATTTDGHLNIGMKYIGKFDREKLMIGMASQRGVIGLPQSLLPFNSLDNW